MSRSHTTLPALLLALALTACGDRPPAAPAPELIVLNADVRTVDSTRPRAEAFAVRGGRFAAIGTSAEIGALAGESTTILDAGGVTVIPGLIDGHTHLLSGAGLATGVDLTDIADKNEWLRIVRAKAETLPAGAWILGGAWNHMLGDGVLPTKEMLDSVAPDNPVLLRDIDGHSAWASSLAIELAGITAESPVPAGGQVLVDPASGEPTGIFLEGASRLFNGAPGLDEARDPVAGARAAVRLANSFGLTGAHDMSGNLDAYLAMLATGDLTMRLWVGVFTGPDDDAAARIESLAADRERIRAANTEAAGPRLEVGYVKMMIDGVLSTHTALMKDPYTDRPDAVPVPFIETARLNEMVAAAHAAGWPVAIHAIGDDAVARVLDAFAANPARAGTLSDRVEHIEVVTPEDVQRFTTLGITASMQPHHATCCVGDYVIDRIGRDRLPNAYVWRQMLDAGNRLVLGSDWPTSPLNPLVQIGDALHRETRIDGVVRPWDEGNTLSFDEALRAYTQSAADMTPWADEIGSISVGKWADFVVLDARVPEDPGRAIEERRVTATWLGGAQVWP